MSEDTGLGFSHEGMPFYLRWYINIRQWFQPYYRYYGATKAPTRKKKKHTAPSRKQPSTHKSSKKTNGGAGASSKAQAPKFRIMNYPKPLDNVMEFKKKPSLGAAWFYHDENVHQIVAHLAPGSGYTFRERDDAARGRLKPLIYPRDQGKPFDRTHLLPIGYHGSENDERLLVGWDSDANRGPFMHFESKQKRRKVPIYWLTFITKTKRGARWSFMIYDAVSLQLIDELHHEMRNKFTWK